MNTYKLELLLKKEFSFMDEVLRKRERKVYKKDEICEKLIERDRQYHGNEPGFRIEDDGDCLTPSYIKNPDSLLIKRGDKNLLAKTPSFDSYSWCNGGHHDHESYCAVVKVSDTFQYHWLREAGSSRTGSGDRNEETADPIGEQLYHLGINPDYIVCYNFQDTDDNNNGEEVLDVVLYKMKNFDLAEYHCEQIDKAARELKAEIRIVCAGGE